MDSQGAVILIFEVVHPACSTGDARLTSTGFQSSEMNASERKQWQNLNHFDRSPLLGSDPSVSQKLDHVCNLNCQTT